MVISYGNLHSSILRIRITMSEQHNLVVVSHVVVRDGNGRRAHDCIHKPISAMRQRVVINPNMTRLKNRNRVTIRHRPPPKMRLRASHHSVPGRSTVMNMQPMHDDVRHVLNRDATAVSDVNVCAASVDRFEAVDDQLLFQLNHHVAFENDP